MTFFNRQPKGIPAGGQFAATAHAEPALTLSAGTPELGTRDAGDMFSAAKDLLGNALQSHRDRIEARRADRATRTRINPVKRRLAVAALVLAAAASMTGCSGESQDCPKAAAFPTSSQSVSYSGSASADITTASFSMKGGGGGGHSSGGSHSSSGHASEGGSTSHEGTTGGSSGSSSGSSGPHFWPWSTGSHSTQCQAHPSTSPAP
jgi:hypothetical protein